MDSICSYACPQPGSLIAPPMSVRQRPRRTQLLKPTRWQTELAARAESRASQRKSVIVTFTRARHSYVGHCPRTRGVSVKSVLRTIAGEKNGAWSGTGCKGLGKRRWHERASERTKGYLTRAMTATIVSNAASKQCRRRVSEPGTESRSFWRGPSFRLVPVYERAFPFLGISIICGPAADSRQIYPHFATENEQCLSLVFFFLPLPFCFTTAARETP